MTMMAIIHNDVWGKMILFLIVWVLIANGMQSLSYIDSFAADRMACVHTLFQSGADWTLQDQPTACAVIIDHLVDDPT